LRDPFSVDGRQIILEIGFSADEIALNPFGLS
jgi:hypothetical protein